MLEWLKQGFYTEENANIYSVINESIKSTKRTPILFIPYLLGERSPFKLEYPHSQIVGINRLTTRVDIALATMESAGFLTKDLLKPFLSNNDTNNEVSLSVSGGLARMGAVNQIKSNILKVPVHVCRNFESTALGCFIIVKSITEATDIYEVIKKYVKFNYTVYPEESQFDYFDRKYTMFKYISTDSKFRDISNKINTLDDELLSVGKNKNL